MIYTVKDWKQIQQRIAQINNIIQEHVDSQPRQYTERVNVGLSAPVRLAIYEIAKIDNLSEAIEDREYHAGKEHISKLRKDMLDASGK